MTKIKGKIKVKIKTKPQCDCENHYLEVLKSFDGEVCTYNRMCYKCGKWWTYTTRIEYRHMKQPSFHGNAALSLKACTRSQLPNVARIVQYGDLLYCIDGNGVTDVYAKALDGTIIQFTRKD